MAAKRSHRVRRHCFLKLLVRWTSPHRTWPRIAIVLGPFSLSLLLAASNLHAGQSHGQVSFVSEASTAQTLLGVTPGITTAAELEANAAWGVPRKDYRGPQGDRYLLYQIKKFQVAVTLIEDQVRTLDVKFLEPASLDVLVKGFNLGNPDPAPLPNEAHVGLQISPQLNATHYSRHLAVVYVQADAVDDTAVEMIRFYSPPAETACSTNAASLSASQAGHDLLEQGQLAEALLKLNEAIEADPQHYCPWMFRAECYLRLNDFASALTNARRVVELQPAAWSYTNLAYIQNRAGDYGEAEHSADQALSLNAEFAQAYLQRGVARANLGRHEAAKQDCDACIARDPQIADAFLLRGKVLTQLGRNRDALQDAQRVVELDPESDQAWSLRAYCYGSLGNFRQARQDIDRAIHLNSSNPYYFELRADARYQLGDRQGAAQDRAIARHLKGQS